MNFFFRCWFGHSHRFWTRDAIYKGTHRKACELFNAAEAAGLPLPGLDCESGWETLPDGTVRHVLKSSFGIGTYQMDVPETEEEWNAAMGEDDAEG